MFKTAAARRSARKAGLLYVADDSSGIRRVRCRAGFRYQTPIGPARVDLGYQLNPIDNLLVDGEPQKRRWRVHFSIGQAF